MILNSKIFSQTSMKYFFFDRLKYKQNDSNKFYKNYHFIQFFNNLLTSFSSAFIALIFTYPFDLAYTRKAAKLVPDGNYENYRSCFNTKIDNMIYNNVPLNKIVESQVYKNQLFFVKYYDNFSLALIYSTISCTVNMLGFSLIKNKVSKNNQEEKKNYSFGSFIKLLGYTSTLTLFTSPIIYPFESILKKFQVNGGRGYNLIFQDNKEGFKICYGNRIKLYK